MHISAKKRRGAVGALLAILLAGAGATAVTPATAAPRAAAEAKAATRASYPPAGDFTATWTRADALKVRSDATNTSPLIPSNFPVMTDDVWIWDTWPMTCPFTGWWREGVWLRCGG